MTRRTWSAVLALSLAGGVYLTAQSAQASNMGFKLERNFDYLRTSAAGNRPLPNIYWMSFPLFNGLGDVADGVTLNPVTNQPYKNVCVGDSNGPPGPAGDGNIDALDAVCDMWTDRNNPSGGGFAFSYYNNVTCSVGAIAAARRFNLPDFLQSIQQNFPPAGTDLWTDRGYQIAISHDQNPAAGDPRNRAVIVGSHDPSFTGRTISFSRTCGTAAARVDLVSVWYHTMYRNSAEILCGLEGVAWTDGNGDTIPDTCTGGIFDDQLGPQHSISVSTVKNDDPAVGGIAGVVPQAARRTALGFTLVPPTPFDLKPGEGYLLAIGAQHVDTVLRIPHF